MLRVDDVIMEALFYSGTPVAANARELCIDHSAEEAAQQEALASSPRRKGTPGITLFHSRQRLATYDRQFEFVSEQYCVFLVRD